MAKDEVDEKKDEIIYIDEDGNIQIINSYMKQLLDFDIKGLKPNKKGGQIKKKRKRSKKKPRGWGKARYGNK